VRKFIATIFCFTVCSIAAAQQVLNNDSIIKLAKAGLSDDVVIATINNSTGQYSTSPEALIALKQAGVTDKVITAMVMRGATPGPVAPSGAASSANAAAPQPATDPAPSPVPDPSGASVITGSRTVAPGSRVVIAPMGGFETYFAAAVREKSVPIALTLDKASAQFYVVSTNTEWQGFVYGSGGSASWGPGGGSASHGAAASSTRGLEASIMLIDARTKDVVWAYEVHKNSHGSLLFGTFGARGQQSIAEACAKHLKEFVEKGK
jgi:hypothetical protein